MILSSHSSLFKFLSNYCSKHDYPSVDIATYGISTTRNHEYYSGWLGPRNLAGKWITEVNRNCSEDNPVRMVVGVPRFMSQTNVSALRYNKMLVQYQKELMHYDNVQSRFCRYSHMKYYRVGKMYIVGGCNLSNSELVDISVTVSSQDDKDRLNEEFEDMWYQGDKTISHYKV